MRKRGEGVEGGGHYRRNKGLEKRARQSLEGQGGLELAVKREDSTSEGSPVSAKWGTSPGEWKAGVGILEFGTKPGEHLEAGVGGGEVVGEP